MRGTRWICVIFTVLALSAVCGEAGLVDDVPFVQFVSNRFAFSNAGLPNQIGRWPVVPELPSKVRRIFASTASLAPCASSDHKCYSFTPRRNQICDLFRRGDQGKDGAWYTDSVQKLCLDLVNDGRSAYLVTADDVYLYDPSFDRILGLKDVLGVDLAAADVLELSIVHDPSAKRFPYEIFSFVSNKAKPNTVSQCMLTTSHVALVNCLDVEDKTLGKVHQISCTLGGRACVVAADGGLYALERLSDAESGTDSLRLTAVKPEVSSTNANATQGPVYQATIQAYITNGNSFSESTGLEMDPETCTIDIAYTTATAIVRPITRGTFGSICTYGAPVFPTISKPDNEVPTWRHEWLAAYQQGNDKNEISKRGLAFTPEGSLYFAMGDAVYRQSSHTSVLAPLATQRISSVEGLPYNGTVAIATAKYPISAYGAVNGVVSSQLYTATVGYFATPRGLTVIEKPNALADNQDCRDAAYDSSEISDFCPHVDASAFTSDDDLARRKFRWMSGPRWLPVANVSDSDVNYVYSASTSYFGRSTWVLLPTGIARIDYLDDFTLQMKADVIEGQIYPRHSRLGLVASSQLATFGNLETSIPQATDNDGLWTSVYLASQALKLGLNPSDADAKSNVETHLQAMQTLFDVTGVSGLMARTYKLVNESEPAPNWYESKSLPGYRWKGDTSSDEVVGHMFIYSLLASRFPNDAFGKIAQKRLTQIVVGILKNGYKLIDVTGKPTTWGVWDPQTLNRNPRFYDGRGVNSAQILAYLNAAAAFGDASRLPFKKLQGHLAKLLANGYDRNIVNLKIQIPEDNNFSDDELTFLPYATWVYADRAQANREPLMDRDMTYTFNLSFARTWKSVEAERTALWTFIRGLQVGPENLDQAVVDHAVENLRRFPIELVDWPFDNTLRQDVAISKYTGRDNTLPRLRVPVPPDESMATRWNADWYVAKGGSGMAEADGGVFLLPFYLGCDLGVINCAH